MNDTLVTHNAFLSNRQPNSLNTIPTITRSLFKTQIQRYPQGPSTRPHRKKTKGNKNTYKRISQQGKFDALALLPLLQSYSYVRRTNLLDFALITEL